MPAVVSGARIYVGVCFDCEVWNFRVDGFLINFERSKWVLNVSFAVLDMCVFKFFSPLV